MVAADFETFRRIVLEDVSLQEQLLLHEDREEFAEVCVRLAARQGLTVSAADVGTALTRARRDWLSRWV